MNREQENRLREAQRIDVALSGGLKTVGEYASESTASRHLVNNTLPLRHVLDLTLKGCTNTLAAMAEMAGFRLVPTAMA